VTRLATLERGFPTFTAPFRWVARSRRRMWSVSLGALALVATPPLWWAMQLIGLPDIGDPFDVAAFRAFSIPEERNAYPLYEQAAARFQALEQFTKPGRAMFTMVMFNVNAPWSNAIPEVRQWAAANRAALALYREASQRPDALGPLPMLDGEHEESWTSAMSFSRFHLLSILEASRLEEVGDFAGAWGWYRASLRTIHLVGVHGTAMRRAHAHDWHRSLRVRVARWAADPKNIPDLVRRAVDDVVDCEKLARSDSYTIKAEYLNLIHFLDDPEGRTRNAPDGWPAAIVSLGLQPSPTETQALYDYWRLALREPERSRRIVRQAVANWLAYFDGQPEAPLQQDAISSGVVNFFNPSPSNSTGRRGTLKPQALTRWLASCIDANVVLDRSFLSEIRLGERSDYLQLLTILGNALYRRDHDGLPPTPEELFGEYLDNLAPVFRQLKNEALENAKKTTTRNKRAAKQAVKGSPGRTER
jgi:hypothetical protein